MPSVLKSRHQILNNSVYFETSSRIRFSKCEQGRVGAQIGKKNWLEICRGKLMQIERFRVLESGLQHKSFLGSSVGLCGPLDPALKPHYLSRFPLPKTVTCGLLLDRDPYAPCCLYFSRAIRCLDALGLLT